MIGRLKGIIVSKHPPKLLLDVNGVGYELESPMTTFYRISEVSKPEVTVYTHLSIREDSHALYGFIEPKERDLFRLLIRINGIGPRLGLAILSGMSISEFVECINNEDYTRLVRLPGVGKKTAERLIIEMREKMNNWTQELEQHSCKSTISKNIIQNNTASNEAISALLSLGFRASESNKAIANVNENGLPSEELIRRALKAMV